MFYFLQFGLFLCAAAAILLADLSWLNQFGLSLGLLGYFMWCLRPYALPGRTGLPQSLEILNRDLVTLQFDDHNVFTTSLCGHSVLTPYFAFLTFREHRSNKCWSVMLFPDHFDVEVFDRLYLRLKWKV